VKLCKLKMTIVLTYDAEFEDVAAASAMIKMLESDPHAGTAISLTTSRWRVQLADKIVGVEVLP
jgi:hypothetical protein